MSPDHDSPYYCPIHGIKAMLTEEGVTGNWDNLEKAKVAVEAHLIRCTAATKIAKLPGLSATVHGYIDVVQGKVSTGGDSESRGVAEVMEEARRRRGEGWPRPDPLERARGTP